MKQFLVPVFVLALVAGPSAAQNAEEGGDLMERGLQLFFEGLREEMSPALENMRKLADEYGPAMFSFMEEMGPALGEMLDQVRDWSAYHPPEILPNGDIIMRKKTDRAPKPVPEKSDPVPKDDPLPQGETEI